MTFGFWMVVLFRPSCFVSTIVPHVNYHIKNNSVNNTMATQAMYDQQLMVALRMSQEVAQEMEARKTAQDPIVVALMLRPGRVLREESRRKSSVLTSTAQSPAPRKPPLHWLCANARREELNAKRTVTLDSNHRRTTKHRRTTNCTKKRRVISCMKRNTLLTLDYI